MHISECSIGILCLQLIKSSFNLLERLLRLLLVPFIGRAMQVGY